MECVEQFGFRTYSPRMRRVLDEVRMVADTDLPVLIQGETGTGKELVASALHSLSPRRAKPLVAVNCSALAAGLIESELFGHERGAFTGAERAFGGRVELAAGGSLFLDEVNSIASEVQAKLLRFLEVGEVPRVGRAHSMRVDVRLIAAANVPLDRLVAAGAMRDDFFQRLNVLRIDVPPLRERLEDLPLLVAQFLEKEPLALRLGVCAARPAVLDELARYQWPGNVRELRNTLLRSIVLRADGAELCAVQWADRSAAAPPRTPLSAAREYPRFRTWMREREQEYLNGLLQRYPTATQRASAAGLPQRTLYRKVRRLRAVRPAAAPFTRVADAAAAERSVSNAVSAGSGAP